MEAAPHRRGSRGPFKSAIIASSFLFLACGASIWPPRGFRGSSTHRANTCGFFPPLRLLKTSLPAGTIVPSSADCFFRRRGGATSPTSFSGKTRSPTANPKTTLSASPSPTSASSIALKMNTVSKEEEDIFKTLIDLGQDHLFQDWPPAGEADDAKHNFFLQVQQLDKSYPGGIMAYIHKARDLLRAAVAQENPFEGMTPSVPDGQTLTYGSSEFAAAEEKGLREAAHATFVVVAGGLGERLGYGGIKLALPVESTTSTTYLEFYASYILALQARARHRTGDASLLLPLAIMTSDDTDSQTRGLLERNNNFGMQDGQVTIIKQDKVPALQDSEARLAPADTYTLDTKPHGHGDVHHLLLRSGLTAQWLAAGKKWVFFLQDTNALVVNSVLPALAVSATHGYDMNSICIPRKAGEASGAITKLTTRNGDSIIINVEYNQLDPLLRATTYPDGDTNDQSTGCSPFPGNANNIVMYLPNYHRVLQGEAQGVVEEFVNPKFKDSSQTAFTKPTRLECMMQDFPKLLAKEIGGKARVGFTSFEKWLSFSPAKNSLEAGAKAFAATGVPPATASSAEMDFYRAHLLKIRAVSGSRAAANLLDGPISSFADIPLETGPRIIVTPAVAVTSKELHDRVGKGRISVTGTSTLVLDGAGISVESLDLDGTFILRAGPRARVTVRDAKVRNAGWCLAPAGPDAAEEEGIRGFRVIKDNGVVVDLGMDAEGDFLVTGNGEVVKQ